MCKWITSSAHYEFNFRTRDWFWERFGLGQTMDWVGTQLKGFRVCYKSRVRERGRLDGFKSKWLSSLGIRYHVNWLIGPVDIMRPLWPHASLSLLCYYRGYSTIITRTMDKRIQEWLRKGHGWKYQRNQIENEGKVYFNWSLLSKINKNGPSGLLSDWEATREAQATSSSSGL